MNFEDMQSQYSCIEHMMRYYGWLFNADGEEEKKEEVHYVCVCISHSFYLIDINNVDHYTYCTF